MSIAWADNYIMSLRLLHLDLFSNRFNFRFLMTDFAEKASDTEIAALNRAVLKVVDAKGLRVSGYRTMVNSGADGGQHAALPDRDWWR